MTLLLREADVQRLLDMPTTLGVVEESFRQLALGRATFVPRQRATAKGIVLHTMSAAADYLGLVGLKAYTTTRAGVRFHVSLYDQPTGKLVALIEADCLGRMRTGATTGVAVNYLAPADAERVALFGAGRQAATQLAALHVVRPIRAVRVFTRDEARRNEFARQMSNELGIEVAPVADPRTALQGAQIVVTATSSATPVFSSEDLPAGAVVCAIGSNWLDRAEIDEGTVSRAASIVCDSRVACELEAGDFTASLRAGKFSWWQTVDLAEVVAGRVVPPPTGAQIQLFKSVGMATEDLAVGAKLIELARQHGVGESLSIAND